MTRIQLVIIAAFWFVMGVGSASTTYLFLQPTRETIWGWSDSEHLWYPMSQPLTPKDCVANLDWAKFIEPKFHPEARCSHLAPPKKESE
jgi:hypothetical protein